MDKQFFVSDLCHVDLGWKRDMREMSELFEIYVLRLLDMLDQNPDYQATVEQAYHLRALASRRPDLYDRLRNYVQQGRVEVLGGMISTMDTNLPCAEAFIRNHLYGLAWVKESLGVTPTTAWLVDTFGLHPQIPQILTQFGFSRLMANRFGGAMPHRAFEAEGLDGSKIRIVGRDVNGAQTYSRHLSFNMVRDWSAVDAVFAEAEAMAGDEPTLVAPYIENEQPLYSRALDLVRQRRAEGDTRWRTATPSAFFDAMEADSTPLPVVSADLNPEFTATFSQRMCIKTRNRAVESQLLRAEQCAVLAGYQAARPSLREAWWKMAYVHFHDTFTGSHPTRVMDEVLRILDEVEATCAEVMERLQTDSGVPLMRAATGKAEQRPVQSICLKNAHLSLTVTERGVTSLRTASGVEVFGKENPLLVLQQDRGSFQMEELIGAEITPALHLQRLTTDGVRVAELTGAFPGFPWMGGQEALSYRLRFTLDEDSPAVRMDAFLSWQGEESRVRLRLNTTIDAADAVFEVPFGVQARGTYGIRATAKGEWPAQRFVALEDGEKGLALINRGVAGVEVQASALVSTLLRAPHCEYAGMVPDETSSQHGEHHFTFLLKPYDGSWVQSGVAQTSEAFNHLSAAPELGLIAEHVLISSVKFAEDGGSDVILRLYETAGEREEISLSLCGMTEAFDCGIQETKKESLRCSDGTVSFSMKPFEIKTIRIMRVP